MLMFTHLFPLVEGIGLLIIEETSKLISQDFSRLPTEFLHNVILSFLLLLANIRQLPNFLTLFLNRRHKLLLSPLLELLPIQFTKLNPLKKSSPLSSLISPTNHSLTCIFSNLKGMFILSPRIETLLLQPIIMSLHKISTPLLRILILVLFPQSLSVEIKSPSQESLPQSVYNTISSVLHSLQILFQIFPVKESILDKS